MTACTAYQLPGAKPHVMGILNVTPDSFSDGGLHASAEKALAHAQMMLEEGADIIDIGAESTRPGSAAVAMEEEWARLEQIIPCVAALGLPISVDTYKAEIARRACAAGAVIINDVWGLQKDPAMPEAAAETGAHVIMMHNRTEVDPDLDIMSDLDRFLEQSMTLADKAGIPREKQILDPGYGFGKTMDQNFIILNRQQELKKHGLPILAAASRKRMIGAALNGAPTQERLFGTLAFHLLAMEKGAAMVRAHDVRPHADAARIFAAMAQEKIAE